MKKLIFINVLFLMALTAVCQNAKTSNTDAPKELTINGIPYSQYKAQQDALQHAAVQKPVVNGGNLTPVQPGSNIPAQKAVDIPRIKLDRPAENAVTGSNSITTNKTAEKVTPVQLPATQMIQVGSLKTSDVSQPVVIPTTSSVKSVNVGNNTLTSAALVQVPTVTLAVDNNAVQSKTTTAISNTPQQVITPAKAAQTPAEIPNSVVAPVQKVTVVPSQKEKN